MWYIYGMVITFIGVVVGVSFFTKHPPKNEIFADWVRSWNAANYSEWLGFAFTAAVFWMVFYGLYIPVILITGLGEHLIHYINKTTK